MTEDEVWWDNLSEGQSLYTPGQSEALAFVGASALSGSKPRKAGFTGRAVLTMATPRPKAERRKEHSMVCI